jgi:hypothetical protein
MRVFKTLIFIGIFLLIPSPVFAASNSEVANFTSQTLNTLIVLATLASVIFLIKGGLTYITSSGKPDALEQAKITVRNALVGLVLVLSAGVISSLLSNAFTTPSIGSTATQIQLKPIEPVTPPNGVTKVLLDAVGAFLQNIVQSATKPLVDGIISFLATTPSLISNSVIFNFWLVILGITDSLFALVIALLGLQFMSASSFGFEEIEFKHLLPRVGLAFLAANSSIFLAEWVIVTCNTLVNSLLGSTGGLTQAWVLNAVDPSKLIVGPNPVMITLIFMLLFVILSVVLLLFYIMRLITLALGAALSPLIFLLWAMPKFSDFAEISIKTYLVTVFTVFVHVVIIQLASAFLTLPGQSGTNSLISILVAVGLFFMLLKTPGFMLQMMFYNTGRGAMKKIGAQIMNVISSQNSTKPEVSGVVKAPRKIIAA